ncbi:MAG: LPS assembly lipoprotein LptE [Gammaproteobacteria bacterium]
MIYLSAKNLNSLLVRYLGQQLRASGARVTKTRDEALSVLEILEDSVDRRVLSVGSTGKVREFELHYVVAYRVLGTDGKEILPRRELALNRAILFDETDVLGKTNEAGLVRREMQQDLVRMIMRQLELVSA